MFTISKNIATVLRICSQPDSLSTGACDAHPNPQEETMTILLSREGWGG
jgi:hypothetical protein